MTYTDLKFLCNHVGMIMGTGTIDIDFQDAFMVHVHVKAGAGDVTLNLQNFGRTMILYLMIQQDSVGGRAFTFQASQFVNGNAPAISTAGDAMDTFIFAQMMGKFHRHGVEIGVK